MINVKKFINGKKSSNGKKFDIRIEHAGHSGSLDIDEACSMTVDIFQYLFRHGFFAKGVSVRFSDAQERVNFPDLVSIGDCEGSENE